MKNIKFKLLPLALIIGIASLILVFSVLGLNTQQNEPQLNIVATNLSFNDSIYIKYAVSFDEVDADNDVKLLIWRNPDADYLMGTEEIALSSVGTLKISDRECLIFNYTDLAAKEVTDVVYARAVYQKDGQTYYSDVKKYSVLTYVYNKLGYTGTATQNEDLASLLKGLLQYGASAQTYFNYKTDTLATDKHVKVSLVNGHFDDGCATALVVPGSKLTITAPLESEHGRFAYWENEDGEIISSSQSYEITAGEVNSSFSAVYASYEGGVVEGAGSSISDDSFALTPHPVNIDSVMDLTASELEAQIREGLEANAVYRVSDGNTVTITDGFDGNGAAIIVPAGITFDSMDNTTVSNVIMLSSVSISNSSQVTFSEVDIQSESNAISVAENCADITLDNCRIIAAKTAFETLSDQTVIKNSYIKGSNGVVLNASENTVYNSHIISDDDAIYSCGSDNALNNNTILTSTNGEGIVIASESLNSLLSYNVVSGTEVSLNIQDATNTVVLFNSFYTAIAENNVNLYIVKNSIGGALELSYNNYLLCDANAYADNESDHTLVSLGNENTNGDTLMDVTARNQVGAKEELLPHTNKDLFLEMERKDIVKDVAGTSLDLHTYIEENAKSNGIVIIPPGAYRTAQADTLILGEAMSNTDIYAFGVYNEHGFITNEEYLTNPNRNNYLISISGAENISIHGMTLAYNYQSLGQAHILQKMDNNQILIVPAAGFDLEAGWGLSNSGIFRGSFYACHKGDSTPWFETETSYTYVQTNADKTIVIEVTEDVYNKLGVGDILCCRMAGDNQRTIEIKNAEKILFKDCVIHGYSAAIACIVSGRSYEVKYERVHNCPKSPAIIDEETYDLYKSFEANYPGVDFEMYKDEEDRYRGTQPRFCSVDATHITSGQGLDIESCLFEQMCDDGSNQHGTSSRLYGIKDNGDGKTATVYIKGNVTQIYHNLYASGTNHVMNMTPGTYLEGDNIFIYTPGGEIVCDATCLTNSKSESHLSEIYNLGKMTYYIHVVSVTVPIESVNFAALEGFDLKDNHFRIDNKIIVDNISYVSGNFTVDNYMIRNSWSRGVLTKTVGATVKYSTFRHIKSAGILAHCEPEWGESTIPRNITVEYCLFDETGHVGESWDDPKNAPFYISGLSTYGEANIDRIVANNIKINGCHFLNYGHQYGICIDGAHSITITNNIFDPLTTSDPGHFVNIKTAVNVELSGNQYRNESDELSTIRGIEADDYVYIHGSDVGDEFKEACDVYIAGTHLSCFKIVPADKENIVVGDILSKKLKAICGYTVASTVMPYTNEVKLVVKDSTSTAIKSHAYTVECIDGQLIITAETNAALIYAVEDFASWIANQNQTQQSIYFAEG